MKVHSLALSLALGASACATPAQQTMPDMPGMTMPQAPAVQPRPKPRPNRTPQPADPMPGDLQGMSHDAGNTRAKAAATSEQNSAQQQAGQAQRKPSPASDADSLTVPVQELQEPEAVGFRTGTDAPAPELLRDVVTQAPMTLDDFLNAADRSNPTLVQAQRNVDRSNAQARQAGLPPDPVVGYSGEHIRGGEYHGGEEGAFFAQEIVLGRKLALRRNVLRTEAHANELATEVQRARVHNDVAHLFIDALAAQQVVDLQDRLLKVALDAETNSHEMERIGQADASDVLNAEIAAEQAKLAFEEAQRTFLSGFAQLRSHAGQRDLPPRPLRGSLVTPPQLDAEALVQQDVEQSPAVGKASAMVSVEDARLRSAKREKVPNLNLKVGEWYSGEVLGSTNLKAGWMSFAEASVQLPLWNRNQGNTAAARAELERAHQDVTRTQLWTRSRAEPEAQRYQTARSAAERYRTEMLPRARRAYQLEVIKYQQMAQAYPHVLSAQRLLFSLQLDYVHALDAEWQAAIALQNYTLMGGLEMPASEGDDTTSRNLPTEPGTPE